MNEVYVCQSCGMPLKHDPKHGGTEANGSLTTKYCSYCYVDGKFTVPEIDTAEKMQDFCINKLKEQGFPKFVAWIFTRNISKLERWK